MKLCRVKGYNFRRSDTIRYPHIVGENLQDCVYISTEIIQTTVVSDVSLKCRPKKTDLIVVDDIAIRRPETRFKSIDKRSRIKEHAMRPDCECSISVSEPPSNATDGIVLRMRAQDEIACTLAESQSLKEVSPTVLREVTEALGFELGILWRVDADVMVCEEIWHTTALEARSFIQKTCRVEIHKGVGLPGKVWVSKQPIWVDESSHSEASITPSASKDNIHSAGCIPIKMKGEVLGAIEFFSRMRQVPAPKMQELMLSIGAQIGLFLDKRRIAECLAQYEEQYRILANTEPDVLMTVNDEFRITFVNASAERVFGYTSSELLGQDLTLLIPEYHDFRHLLAQSVKTESLLSKEMPGLHKSGNGLVLEVVFSAFSGREDLFINAPRYSTIVIRDITDKVSAKKALKKCEQKLKTILADSPGSSIIAEAPAMRELIERVKKAAVSYASILIQGETGSGKECIAHMIHRQSPLAARPFVARNCASIPATLFESEMFGHKKGSFTGSDRDRKGAFLEADGGTLFLDEIGDLEYSLQTKLLRAIQEKVILPVGGDKEIPVNPRIICATNRDLLKCTRDRKFREDLYYRLVTVLLVVPPLRERREDIIPLARHFTGMASAWTRTLSPEAEQRLLMYDWPGNVRELRSLIDQSVIFAIGNEIQASEITFPAGGSSSDRPYNSLANVERRHIQKVMNECDGNKTEAAKILGLARSTLVLKLKSYAEEGSPTSESEDTEAT